MQKLLKLLWFPLRYIVVMTVFIVVVWLNVALHEPTPLWTKHDWRTWSPLLLLEDRLILEGKDDATPEGHETIRTFSLDGVELSRFHLVQGVGTFVPKPPAMLAAIMQNDEGYRLLHWDLINQSKTLDVEPPAIPVNEPLLIVDRDIIPSSNPKSGTHSIFFSANGEWCGLQVNQHLTILHQGKVARVFTQDGAVHFRAISNDGRKLIGASHAFGYLIDLDTRTIIKKSIPLLRSIPQPTYEGKHFLAFDHNSGMNPTVDWLSVETGEVERHLQVPLPGDRKFIWGFVVPLKSGDVVSFTAENTTLYPIATEWATWLESKTGIKLDWNWLTESKTRGTIHFIHPDGSTERVRLGNNVSHAYFSPDGQYLLARNDTANGLIYSLFRLPLPSPIPDAILYALLAALPLLLLQWWWQRLRRRPAALLSGKV